MQEINHFSLRVAILIVCVCVGGVLGTEPRLHILNKCSTTELHS